MLQTKYEERVHTYEIDVTERVVVVTMPNHSFEDGDIITMKENKFVLCEANCMLEALFIVIEVSDSSFTACYSRITDDMGKRYLRTLIK